LTLLENVLPVLAGWASGQAQDTESTKINNESINPRN